MSESIDDLRKRRDALCERLQTDALLLQQGVFTTNVALHEIDLARKLLGQACAELDDAIKKQSGERKESS
jgi:hypothetical protein